ncbi:MAG: YidC/Oxa1 family membrane protein insertase [Pseudaminobacter sp.]|nr:YidC/Oxa1 family membrane protein insertase [Pseudaminobacter sp.]
MAIIVLSIIFSLLMLPLSWRAQAAERRAAAKATHVRREIAARRGKLKGEALFDLTEQIYHDNGFHPIKTVMTGAGLMVMLPVLISSIIVIGTSSVVDGASFLVIYDLGKPDGLLKAGSFSFNLLPLLMFAISLCDAVLRYRGSPADVAKFSVVSLILLFLVYGLASGLVLYWITSNLFAAVVASLSRAKIQSNPG